MVLSRDQRKHMASIRTLIAASEWSSVAHGLALLDGLDDATLWEIMAGGVSISRGGRPQLNGGEIEEQVVARHQVCVALHAARRAGFLDDLTALDLSNSSVSDLRPLEGLIRLTTLNLNYNPSIQDLRPLEGLAGLKTLNITDTRASHTDTTALAAAGVTVVVE